MTTLRFVTTMSLPRYLFALLIKSYIPLPSLTTETYTSFHHPSLFCITVYSECISPDNCRQNTLTREQFGQLISANRLKWSGLGHVNSTHLSLQVKSANPSMSTPTRHPYYQNAALNTINNPTNPIKLPIPCPPAPLA